VPVRFRVACATRRAGDGVVRNGRDARAGVVQVIVGRRGVEIELLELIIRQGVDPLTALRTELII
jgi:hypothetical protein